MEKVPIDHIQPASTKRLILAAQLAFLPTGILTTLLGPMLPLLIARWSLNDTQAGNLFLVQFLSSLVGVQLAGVLLSRLGFRPSFLLGLLLMAGGTATLYMGSVGLGMASVAVYGLGLGLIIPTDNLLIAELSSTSRSGAVSLLNFFWGIGAVLCSLLVAWAEAHRALPFFLGAVSLLLVLLAFAMRGLAFPPAAPSRDRASNWRELVKLPAVWLFAAVFFLYPGAETAVGGWIGSYVSRLGPREAAMAPLMPAFFWAALTLGRGLGTLTSVSRSRASRLARRLRDRIGRNCAHAVVVYTSRSHRRSSDHGAQLFHFVSDHGGPPVAAFWCGRAQHRGIHVFPRFPRDPLSSHGWSVLRRNLPAAFGPGWPCRSARRCSYFSSICAIGSEFLISHAWLSYRSRSEVMRGSIYNRDALARRVFSKRSGAVEASSTRLRPLCLARYKA